MFNKANSVKYQRMTDWQKRVVDECEELCNKVVKLEAFINTPEFAKIHVREQELLKLQYETMFRYGALLNLRIEGY